MLPNVLVLALFQSWVFAAFLAGMKGQGVWAPADPCDLQIRDRAERPATTNQQQRLDQFFPGTAWSFHVAFIVSSYKSLIYYWDLKTAA